MNDAYEKPKILTPFYQDALTSLYCGDVDEILPQIDIIADAVITDPPYGKTSLKWDVWPEGWPTLVANCAPQIWCFGSMKMFFEKIDQFASWKFAQEIIWEKHNGSNSHNDRFRAVERHLPSQNAAGGEPSASNYGSSSVRL